MQKALSQVLGRGVVRLIIVSEHPQLDYVMVLADFTHTAMFLAVGFHHICLKRSNIHCGRIRGTKVLIYHLQGADFPTVPKLHGEGFLKSIPIMDQSCRP